MLIRPGGWTIFSWRFFGWQAHMDCVQDRNRKKVHFLAVIEGSPTEKRSRWGSEVRYGMRGALPTNRFTLDAEFSSVAIGRLCI